MTATTIIAGHSHIVAMGVPLKSAKNELLPIAGADRFLGFTGNWPRAPDYWTELVRISDGRTLALSWRGNQHMSQFLLARSPKIDFVLAERTDLAVDETAMIIPELALREVYAPFLTDLRKLLPELGPRTKKLLLLSTPPPKGDDAFCRAYLNKEPAFGKMAERLGVSIDSVEFSAPLIRLKHWCLMQRMLREVAKEHGATYVPPPDGTQDPIGFLRKEFWAEDVSHANSAYGEAVLQQLSAVT